MGFPYLKSLWHCQRSNLVRSWIFLGYKEVVSMPDFQHFCKVHEVSYNETHYRLLFTMKWGSRGEVSHHSQNS